MRKTKIKFSRKILGMIFVSAFVFGGVMVLPSYSIGASSDPTSSDFQIVPTCTGESTFESDGTLSGTTGECGWADLMTLISNIMEFLVYIAVSIGILACCYAGFLYVTAFGESGKIEQAHKIFSSAMTGFLIILLAWLIVATILVTMGVSTDWTILDTSSVKTITGGDGYEGD